MREAILEKKASFEQVAKAYSEDYSNAHNGGNCVVNRVAYFARVSARVTHAIASPSPRSALPRVEVLF